MQLAGTATVAIDVTGSVGSRIEVPTGTGAASATENDNQQRRETGTAAGA